GVGDVVLALRLAVLEQPLARLDAQDVLGTAASVDVVAVGVDRVGHEGGRQRPGRVGRGVGRVVGEHLVPVVRGGRRTRCAQHTGGGVAVQLEQVQGKGVAVAGAGALRAEEVQRHDGTDGDRNGGAAGEGSRRGRQEGGGAERGRVERAGGDAPGQQGRLRQLVGGDDVEGS